MTKYKDWTEDEFRAYLFLYAADSNFEYHEEEKSFIESKFDSETLKKIKEQTDDLNDYQRSHAEIMIAFYDEWLKQLGFRLMTPRDKAKRGGHISVERI